MGSGESNKIAVVGMACIFPGARDVRAFWNNIRTGYDAIGPVPEARWEKVFLDRDSKRVDRVYCDRGGFIDDLADFDATEFGVMPVAARSSEPDQLLTLKVAAAALADAGYGDEGFDGERCGVILGRGGYVNSGMARLIQKVKVSQELVGCLEDLIPGISAEQLEAVREAYQAKLGHIGPDTVIGLVPNLAASRVANRLDMKGPAYCVDAACASSLLAVDHAVRALQREECDMVLAGGVHLTQDVVFWSVFSQLGALSRKGEIRPFDKHADGLLMGEGLGTIVLKRLEDAERDGDRIHAVLAGTGVSSDGRASTLMSPGTDGQLLALKRAWANLDLDPKAPGAVGLIEAHGTATPAGDAAELETLARFFGGPSELDQPGIGSIKSMIGHAMPAAGIAGLIKAICAVRDGVLPPTLNCSDPHPALERTRFRILQEAEPWESNGSPRRAGVNAFGFGGINAHVVVEEHRSSTTPSIPAELPLPTALLLAGESASELLAALSSPSLSREPGVGPCRLAVMDPTPERVAKARAIVQRGKDFRGRNGIWFTNRGLLHEGKLAFVYPGVDADFRPRIRALASLFGRPLPKRVSVELARLSSGSATSADLERTGVAIILVNRLLSGILADLGLEPDMVAGHSIGEWSAMLAAGALADDNVDGFIAGLEGGSLQVPGVGFASVACERERAEPLLAGIEGLHVSHENCPHQHILCGADVAIDAALEQLAKNGILCHKLPFRSGFHSPAFEPHLEGMHKSLERFDVQAPRLQLWSATTTEPYPSSPDEIEDMFLKHLVEPVRFQGLIRNMHRDGARVFVQVGTGSLTGFVDDTLKGEDFCSIQMNTARRSGPDQLARAATALWVEGATVRLGRILASAPSAADRESPSGTLRLALGAPLVRLDEPLKGIPVPGRNAQGDENLGESESPVLEQLQSNLRRAGEVGREVLDAYRETRSPEQLTRTRLVSLETCPFLIDHAFFPQPEGWPNPADRFPLVPMTMSLEMIVSTATELVAPRVVIGLERVRAWRWMAVEQPQELTIEARRVDGDPDRVHVSIGDYIEGTALVADAYPEPPAPDTSRGPGEKELGMDAATMYARRWMFHGPAYQAVTDLGAIGERTLHGKVKRLEAEGSLFDGAGQMFGLWISLSMETDRMALPVRVEKVNFFGPPPAVGTEFDCTTRIHSCGERQVIGDIELVRDGRVHARLEGWEDRRFESNPREWPVIRYPERNLLAIPRADVPGCVWLPQGYRSTATRDYYARRFLDGPGLEFYRGLMPKRQIDWLSGRIVAVDAVRQLLFAEGRESLFPVEVRVTNDNQGRPEVDVDGELDLRVSLAHSNGAGVALATRGDRVGVDMEPVTERDEGFESTAFTASERALLVGAVGSLERADGVARLWTAKEARGKWLGTGLVGGPRQLLAQELDGERVRVDGRWIETLRTGDWIIAWVIGEDDAQ
ncbi:MAG: beta-ketoacyl synthase N-terminal-like domain-containing protein [Planctomycetota bacterium]|nr:beta-ketoacyl synthase N-terminal-like domain-containing protein [Planctomycetota bacterium]